MINDDNNCSKTEGTNTIPATTTTLVCQEKLRSLSLIYVVNILIDLKYEYFFLVMFLCNISNWDCSYLLGIQLSVLY